MVRRLISSIVIATAAISVVGSAAATENVVESANIHTKKDVHQKVQATDDVDTSSTKVEALSTTTPKAEKKLNNVESESSVDDTVSATKSPWTRFDIPSFLSSTKDFYKIDKSSSNDGKWSTIANAQVCRKFGTSSIHVTLYEKMNRSSLMINYRSDVFDDTTSTSGDFWYLTIVDGDVESGSISG